MEKTGDEYISGCGCNKERQSPKGFQKLWEYLFAPWEITVVKRGTEKWSSYQHGMKIPYSGYSREYVIYKYSHKFRKEEKIVKQYLN